jgi:hypothetical protein
MYETFFANLIIAYIIAFIFASMKTLGIQIASMSCSLYALKVLDSIADSTIRGTFFLLACLYMLLPAVCASMSFYDTIFCLFEDHQVSECGMFLFERVLLYEYKIVLPFNHAALYDYNIL